jgi:phage/plasmid-associated DNA primase
MYKKTMTNPLLSYLSNFKAEKGGKITHTRIGHGKKPIIYGGAYHIPDEKYMEFMELYYSWVVEGGNEEYLTEKQEEVLAIDFDFRYDTSIKSRQHTHDHIIDCVVLYAEKIAELVNIKGGTKLKAYILQKPKVNVLENKTKDGIHVLFNINLDRHAQQLLRQNVLPALKGMWEDLPITNDFEDVLDEGVTKASSNWQLIGSQKPGNEAYALTHIHELTYDKGHWDINLASLPIPKPLCLGDILTLSVRNKKDLARFDLKPETQQQIEAMKTKKQEQPAEQIHGLLTPPPEKRQYNAEGDDIYLDLLFNLIGNGYNKKGQKEVNYQDRLCICYTLKSNGYDKAVFQKYCDLREGKGKDNAETLWDGLEVNNKQSLFTLQGLAKRINPTGYEMWFIKHKAYIKISVLKKGENDVAKYIANYLEHKMVYCNKVWWIFDANVKVWRHGTPTAIVISEIQRQIDMARKCLFGNIMNTEDDHLKKELRAKDKEYEEQYKIVGKSSFSKQVENCLKEYLLDTHFETKLDVNTYKVAYQNGMLNLKTLELAPLKATDYITSYIPYAYEEGSAGDIAWVREQVLKICGMNEEKLDYYLSYFGYSMTGHASVEQVFFNLLGPKASNGKSVIFEALMKIIPNYISKTENDVFALKYGSRHKEIATWRGIRILWVNELSKDKQDGEFLKDLSDGTGTKYKVMYGLTSMMAITFKLAVVSNNTLNFDACGGMARRLRSMKMNSDFTDNVEEDDPKNCVFKKDKLFGEKLATTYKYALMSLIYQYSKAFVDDGYKMKPYPKEWEEENRSIISNADTFSDFFEQYFIEEEGAKLGRKKAEQFLAESRKGKINFKDELERMKITFKYESQKKEGGGKGCYYGIRLKTDEEQGLEVDPDDCM